MVRTETPGFSFAQIIVNLLANNFSRVVTGTFTGDAAATQAIVGVGFQGIAMLVVRGVDYEEQGFWFKTAEMLLNATMLDFVGGVIRWNNDMLISFDPDGFTVGDTLEMNVLNDVYYYVIWG